MTFSRTLVGWCEFCGSIVQPFMLAVRGHPAGSLLSLHYSSSRLSVMIKRGTYCKPFNSLPQELLSGLLTPATLDQNVKHLTLLVYCSPRVMILAVELDEHYV